MQTEAQKLTALDGLTYTRSRGLPNATDLARWSERCLYTLDTGLQVFRLTEAGRAAIAAADAR